MGDRHGKSASALAMGQHDDGGFDGDSKKPRRGLAGKPPHISKANDVEPIFARMYVLSRL